MAEQVVANVAIVAKAADFIARAKQHEEAAAHYAHWAGFHALKAGYYYFSDAARTKHHAGESEKEAEKAVERAELAKYHAFAARKKAAEDADNDVDIDVADRAAAAAREHAETALQRALSARKHVEAGNQLALPANMGN